MGYVKEPDGVDFVIKSKPLTDKERAALSEFIQKIKEREKAKRLKRRSRLSTTKEKKDS